jgi:hypothetical protein
MSGGVAARSISLSAGKIAITLSLSKLQQFI